MSSGNVVTVADGCELFSGVSACFLMLRRFLSRSVSVLPFAQVSKITSNCLIVEMLCFGSRKLFGCVFTFFRINLMKGDRNPSAS